MHFYNKLTYCSNSRSLWIICSFLLHLSKVDVWTESGAVWFNVWPGDVT